MWNKSNFTFASGCRSQKSCRTRSARPIISGMVAGCDAKRKTIAMATVDVQRKDSASVMTASKGHNVHRLHINVRMVSKGTNVRGVSRADLAKPVLLNATQKPLAEGEGIVQRPASVFALHRWGLQEPFVMSALPVDMV
jgi:lambda repressor-like predicted transcriptional regulator